MKAGAKAIDFKFTIDTDRREIVETGDTRNEASQETINVMRNGVFGGL